MKRILIGALMFLSCSLLAIFVYNYTVNATSLKQNDKVSIDKKDNPEIKDNIISQKSQIDEIQEEKRLQREFLKEKIIKDNVIKSTLEEKIKADLGGNIDNIGISYYDINTGTYIGINDDKMFTAGSTVKVAVGIVLSDMIEKGELNKTDTIMYRDSFYEDGAGVLQGSSLLNNPITIDDLMGYMIKNSDNIATNMLINKIGYSYMKDKFSEILGHAVDKNSNSITAKEAYSYLIKLYENKEGKQSYEHLKELMKNTTTHDRIDKYLPQQNVSHKIGDYNSFVNDIGIIYGDNPYILTIYSNNTPNANELIANLSKDIYDIQMTR